MLRYLLWSAAGLVLLTGVIWFARPAQYEAYALVRVASEAPEVLADRRLDLEQFKIFKRTQMQLILSGPVMRGAVMDPAVQRLSVIEKHRDDPAAWLKEQLLLDYPDDAEVLRVAMKGRDPDETIKIVDTVVAKYLTEVVHANREKNLQQAEKLQKKYDDLMTNFMRESEALHTLQQVNGDSASQAAGIEKKLAMAELDEAIATRNFLKRALLENSLQIKLMQAKEDLPPEARTSGVPIHNTADEREGELTLPLLEKQREFLEEALQRAEASIEKETAKFDTIEKYSANVAAKRRELAALEQIMTELKADIDRNEIERLSADRIEKIDDAQLESNAGDTARKYAGLAVAVLVGLGLAAGGFVSGRRRRAA